MRGGQNLVLTSSGNWHVKFVWQSSTVPAPHNVIVHTYSLINGSGPSNTTTGSADNGLNSTLINNAGTVSSSGDQYRPMQPNSSGVVEYDVPVSCIINATNNIDPPSYGRYVQLRMGFTAQINDITFDVNGTIKDNGGADNILIGQICAAGVHTTAPVIIGDYAWSVSGQTFCSFAVSADLEWGQPTLDTTPSIWFSAYPNWAWVKGNGTETIQYTAHVFSNGQNMGPISDTRTIAVQEPDSDFQGVTPGVVNYNADQSLVQAGGVDNAAQPGITFPGYVTTPSLFCLPFGSGTPFDKYGWWNSLQLCSYNRVRYAYGGVFQFSKVFDGYLDNGWSYMGDYVGNGVGTKSQIQDGPSQELTSGTTQYYVYDNYKMYMMYKPPGNSCWVPLRLVWWRWTVSGGRSTPLSAWSPNPPNGSVSVIASYRCTIHPQWTHRYQNVD